MLVEYARLEAEQKVDNKNSVVYLLLKCLYSLYP